jgi:hypothetical protein
MVDTLETAGSFGLVVAPKASKALGANIDFDPYKADTDRLVDAWIPLTFAANSMNRSMGMPDLYPFMLSPPVIAKLAFIRDVIHAHSGRRTQPNSGIRAMIAGLRRRAGFQDRTKHNASDGPEHWLSALCLCCRGLCNI